MSDDFSKLTSAEVVQVTIHIQGESNNNAAVLQENDLDSRKTQAIYKLCTDDVMSKAVTGNAASNLVWASQGDKKMGEFQDSR